MDLINAFNLCDRDSAFWVVEEVFPDILRWVLGMTCYGTNAVLMFGDTIIVSECGSHQGDPLASLLFSLTLHPIALATVMLWEITPSAVATKGSGLPDMMASEMPCVRLHRQDVLGQLGRTGLCCLELKPGLQVS